MRRHRSKLPRSKQHRLIERFAAGTPAGKVAVFGILKRGGRVYTVVSPDLKRSTLMPIIRRLVRPTRSSTPTAYDTLDVAGFEHHRIDHGETLVSESGAHINGIENFWSQAKRHLHRYNGIPKTHFELFLKECEWRFNYGSPQELRQTLLNWHLI